VNTSWVHPTFFIRNHLCELGVIFLIIDSCMTKIFVFIVQCQPLALRIALILLEKEFF
jgi:hypothetical protein